MVLVFKDHIYLWPMKKAFLSKINKLSISAWFSHSSHTSLREISYPQYKMWRGGGGGDKEVRRRKGDYGTWFQRKQTSLEFSYILKIILNIWFHRNVKIRFFFFNSFGMVRIRRIFLIKKKHTITRSCNQLLWPVSSLEFRVLFGHP